MGYYLGIDTSNYTTSVALYDSENKTVRMEKRLLPVKEGSIGLKQSDAVFHHVKQLPELLHQLTDGQDIRLDGVGVSVSPRRQEGSYMPCFLVGKLAAETAAITANAPIYEFSHQEGHVMAALYSAGQTALLEREFYAFHLSGGTTECLSVRYENQRFDITLLSRSLDLKAGQAVDRVGVMLGLPFPAGPMLDRLACGCDEKIKVKPCLKGLDCSLSVFDQLFAPILQAGK